jgi:hypothetical protein
MSNYHPTRGINVNVNEEHKLNETQIVLSYFVSDMIHYLLKEFYLLSFFLLEEWNFF